MKRKQPRDIGKGKKLGLTVLKMIFGITVLISIPVFNGIPKKLKLLGYPRGISCYARQR
jgi:hypothetical protein